VIKKLKHITVSESNYFALKQLGDAADSFNDVITEVLKKKKANSVLEFDSEVGACDQIPPSTSASNQSITKRGRSNVG
jgi:hypothetical protein